MTTPRFTLHHHPLDAPSRRVRLTLAEKGLPFDLVPERPWSPRPAFLQISPAGEVPVLVIETPGKNPPHVLANADAICEYLEEVYPDPPLLFDDPLQRAEVRRLTHWFEYKMYEEVTSFLISEKVMKRLIGGGEPDSARIQTGYHNIHGHLAYISWLTQRRNWLAGDQISFADLAAATQLSVLDYLGDVPWEKHPETKEWYARIKSRPSFRPILGDHIAGLIPSRSYANLDF